MLPKPPDDYQDESQAKALLDRFVNGGTYEGLTRLPKRAAPPLVDEFLGKTLDSSEIKDRQLSRCGELMRFYDLRAGAKQIAGRLDRKEKDLPLFERSMSALAILGDLGDDALQDQAAQYYQYLSSHRVADQCYGRLVDLFFHLPAAADPKSISEPIEARVKSLEPKIESDQDSAVVYYALKDLLDDRLPTVVKAKQRKHAILKTPDTPRRRLDLARWYLGLERNAYVDLRTWAMMMLQRECNAGKPEELAERFSHSLDLIMSEASRRHVSGGDVDDLKSYVTSCARAVEFYGGALNEKQAAYAEEHKKKDQSDILYWEPEESKEATTRPGGHA
jgi:hypothetical protein